MPFFPSCDGKFAMRSKYIKMLGGGVSENQRLVFMACVCLHNNPIARLTFEMGGKDE